MVTLGLIVPLERCSLNFIGRGSEMISSDLFINSQYAKETNMTLGLLLVFYNPYLYMFFLGLTSPWISLKVYLNLKAKMSYGS